MYLDNNIIIDRNKILIGEVVQGAQYYKGGLIANLMCDAEEINKLPFYDYGKIGIQKTPILRGMIFIIDSNNKTIDIGNPEEEYKYPIVNKTENLIYETKHSHDISIRDCCAAEGLLEYLGFKNQLTLSDIENFKRIISKEKRIATLAQICGYRKINTFLTNALDYEQETKLGRNYYKFTGSTISSSDRCKYKEEGAFVKPIKNFSIFELLASNVPFGYEISEQEKILKLGKN